MIIDEVEGGIHRRLDLSELSKKKLGKKEVINWFNSESCTFTFRYEVITAYT